MEQELRAHLESLTENLSWTAVHILVLGSLEGNWREYINYLDSKTTELVRIQPKCGLVLIFPDLLPVQEYLQHSIDAYAIKCKNIQ